MSSNEDTTPPSAPDEDSDPRHHAPLVVDAAPLHALVDELGALLHEYVDTAVGVRAEFDAPTAEDDPRVEVVEDRIARLNTAIMEAFEERLGLVSGHTAESWEDEDEDEDTGAGADDDDADGPPVFELSFVLTVADADGRDHDELFQVVDTVGTTMVEQLADTGLEVREWGVSYASAEDDEDEDEA